MSKILVKCGWCKKKFETDNQRGKWGYRYKACPHCGRTVMSSKKELTERVIGRKHIHLNLKEGDVV